ncbi:AtpZ/AtpI family protein [Roseovarius sp. SCSIO 43702]|uniref:AtpZ/AtpI family protein n=1 Tax=Roseovarius sp. SCSIO 43702 TaxID=2823043 RepID=UPI001C733C11|nr:AtpZ/AtpI family protein [Roseovarius sp. SCSIO 43702]QYX58693.1 AtpZ/AtpI family protein [Roseovarius sp. SCSIO 43702]
MSQGDEKERLAALEARIAALKTPKAEKSHTEEHYSQAQLAWRMVIELVAGLLIGFGIGYGLDRLLGTLPLFLVLFTLLGLAAGIKTMIRSAEEIQRKQVAEEAEKMAPDDAGEGKGTQTHGD